MDPKSERRGYLQDKISDYYDSFSHMIDKMVDMPDEEVEAELALPEAERKAKVDAWNAVTNSYAKRIEELEAELKALDEELD